MKRSNLTRKPFRRKTRKPLRKKSTRMLLINKIEDLLRAKLKRERGDICQICGKKTCRPVGLFHILHKGVYPKLRFHEENLLLVGWLPCHHAWHHDYFKARAIESRIKELRGRDYEDLLKIIDKMQPKLSMFQLRLIHKAFEELNELKPEKNKIW